MKNETIKNSSSKKAVSASMSIAVTNGDHAEIGDCMMPRVEGNFDNVPEINSAYHFPKETFDVLADIKENIKVFLTGHTGAGKSSLIEQIAARINQPTIRINMTADTSTFDFIGNQMLENGNMLWVDGPLTKAMREGHWLIIDELDCASASILALLNPVLEDNGKLFLKENRNEVVKPHKNFRLFATGNSVGAMEEFRYLYPGTNPMNEALKDRWRIYLMEYLPQDIEIKVLIASIPGLDKKSAGVMVGAANSIRDSFIKKDLSCSMSTRRLIDWAKMYMRHKDLKMAAERSFYSKVLLQDRNVIEELLNASIE